jgi:hypothetical protein
LKGIKNNFLCSKKIRGFLEKMNLVFIYTILNIPWLFENYKLNYNLFVLNTNLENALDLIQEPGTKVVRDYSET